MLNPLKKCTHEDDTSEYIFMIEKYTYTSFIMQVGRDCSIYLPALGSSFGVSTTGSLCSGPFATSITPASFSTKVSLGLPSWPGSVGHSLENQMQSYKIE